MEISLRLGEFGWSDLDLWLVDQHHEFRITHIFGSPMVDIADAIVALHRGDELAAFTLHDEPGSHVWTMARIPEEQHLLLVEIRSYRENFHISKSAEQVIEFRVARDFFIGSFAIEFEKIAFQISHPRFAKTRDVEDFPWDRLRILQTRRSKRSEQDAAE